MIRFKLSPLIVAFVVATVTFALPSSVAVDTPSAAAAMDWRELESPRYLWPGGGAIYYSLDTKNGTKAHLIVVDTRSGKWRFRPVVNDPTAATSDTAVKYKASGAVNGGYFNITDGVSASYVFIDGKEAASPRINRALIENPKLASYLEHIFNRSEIRILLDDSGAQTIRIMPHEDPVPSGLRLLHSLQAGPQLLPTLSERQEAFVRVEPDGKEADSIGCRRRAARTAFGITAEGYAMLVCVSAAGQDPESRGLTLAELAELLKVLGCTQAINLDGGASSTMWVRLRNAAPDSPIEVTPGQVVCSRQPETKVKSVLLLHSAEPLK